MSSKKLLFFAKYVVLHKYILPLTKFYYIIIMPIISFVERGDNMVAKLNFHLIGERIRSSRKAAGMTQKELAALVNLSEGSVSKYEHGKVADASTTKLAEFAMALDLELSWLLGLNNPDELKPPIEFDKRVIDALNNNPILSDFILRIVDLNDSQQEEIISTGLFLVAQRNKQKLS